MCVCVSVSVCLYVCVWYNRRQSLAVFSPRVCEVRKLCCKCVKSGYNTIQQLGALKADSMENISEWMLPQNETLDGQRKFWSQVKKWISKKDKYSSENIFNPINTQLNHLKLQHQNTAKPSYKLKNTQCPLLRHDRHNAKQQQQTSYECLCLKGL